MPQTKRKSFKGKGKRRSRKMQIYKTPTARLRDSKFIDNTHSLQIANDGGDAVRLAVVIAQGTTESERVGRDVILKSVWIRGFVRANSAATVNFCRTLIVWDKQPNGALAGITAILGSHSSQALPNDTNRDRFVTLWQKAWAVTGHNTAPATGNEMQVADMYKKLPDFCHTVYGSGAGGAITDIQTGALLLVCVGNVASGTATAQWDFHIRVRYVDRF